MKGSRIMIPAPIARLAVFNQKAAAHAADGARIRAKDALCQWAAPTDREESAKRAVYLQNISAKHSAQARVLLGMPY